METPNRKRQCLTSPSNSSQSPGFFGSAPSAKYSAQTSRQCLTSPSNSSQSPGFFGSPPYTKYSSQASVFGGSTQSTKSGGSTQSTKSDSALFDRFEYVFSSHISAAINLLDISPSHYESAMALFRKGESEIRKEIEALESTVTKKLNAKDSTIAFLRKKIADIETASTGATSVFGDDCDFEEALLLTEVKLDKPVGLTVNIDSKVASNTENMNHDTTTEKLTAEKPIQAKGTERNAEMHSNETQQITTKDDTDRESNEENVKEEGAEKDVN